MPLGIPFVVALDVLRFVANCVQEAVAGGEAGRAPVCVVGATGWGGSSSSACAMSAQDIAMAVERVKMAKTVYVR